MVASSRLVEYVTFDPSASTALKCSVTPCPRNMTSGCGGGTRYGGVLSENILRIICRILKSWLG